MGPKISMTYDKQTWTSSKALAASSTISPNGTKSIRKKIGYI